jgi:uncharacterized alpha-E superfamily protein
VNLDLFPASYRIGYTLAAAEREIYRLIHQAHRLGTVRELLGRLRQIAFVLRERLSADTWSILNRLQMDASARPGRVNAVETLSLLNTIILDLAAFSGMEMENMTRGHGWHFLDIGRRLERGINTITLIQAGLSAVPHDDVLLETVLDIADSTMTYRRRFVTQPQWAGTLDLLAADETNPRSLAFQVHALAEHAQNLPPVATFEGNRTPSRRLDDARLLFEVLTRDLESIAADREPPGKLCDLLARFGGELRGLSDTLTHQYFSHADTQTQ